MVWYRLLLVPVVVLTLAACGEEEKKADRAAPAPTTTSKTETADKKAPPEAWVKSCTQELAKDESTKARADQICSCLAKGVTESDISAADRDALYKASVGQSAKPEGMSEEGHKKFEAIAKQCVTGTK